MIHIWTSYAWRNLLASLAGDEITLTTGLVWLLIAAALAIVGGAIGGILLAGKDIGYKLSAILGGLLAPAGVIPAILLGLFLLSFLTKN